MEEKTEHKVVDELADEIVELLSNSQKFSKFLEKMDSDNFHSNNAPEPRIENIEQKLNKLIQNFKLVSIELERMTTEKTEMLRKEHDEEIQKIYLQIEQLRQAIIRVANEVKGLRGSQL